MQIEIPDEVGANLTKLAEETGQDVASLAAEMLTEAIKMRRVPGILFADGATGRRARIGGTGIEVFEVIQAYIGVDRDRDELRKTFDWLADHQIDDALKYYKLYPEDIEPRLYHSDEEFEASFEAMWQKYPFMRPPWR